MSALKKTDLSGQAENTNREIWREIPGDYYSDRIFVTREGNIGIDCGGHVFIMPVRKWWEAAEKYWGKDPGYI